MERHDEGPSLVGDVTQLGVPFGVNLPVQHASRRWYRQATDVMAHDFPSDAVAQAIPYGVYDPELNRRHVCVGTSGDAADLAVVTVQDCWRQQGQPQCNGAMAVVWVSWRTAFHDRRRCNGQFSESEGVLAETFYVTPDAFLEHDEKPNRKPRGK